MYSKSIFHSHDLHTQSSAALMDRVEAKFVMPLLTADNYLKALVANYTILEINSRRVFTYESRYFDTPDMSSYKAHHNGKLNRYKVRLRQYREAETAFMEVKTKNNKQRVCKERIRLLPEPDQKDRVNLFIKSAIGMSFAEFIPVMDINYQRLTLMSRDMSERVTVDTGLKFRSLTNERTVELSGLTIVEIKCSKKFSQSYAYRKFVGGGEKQQKFSKYCVAVGLTDDTGLKTNRFKPTLCKMRKLFETGPCVPKFQLQDTSHILQPVIYSTQTNEEPII